MTATKIGTADAVIAWPSLIWIGGLHLGALLAFVPGTFHGPGFASAWCFTG